MTPVEIEFLMRDKLTPGMERAGKSAEELGRKAEGVSKSVKDKIEEQRTVIKQIEKDIRSLEKEYKRLSPGKAKMEMEAELNAAKKVLQEEKNALNELSGAHQETEKTAKRLSAQLREMHDEMARMRLDGKQGSEAYEELRQKAAMLADTLGDVRTETNVLAHDNAGLQGLISGVSGLAGAFTIATGVMGVFAGQNEDLIKIQTKVQSVMAITMGLQQVMNVLNKDSQFRLHTVTKAKNMLTAANHRLAASLHISNAAAKALMATLTLGVSVAITAAIAAWNKYSDAQEKAAEKRKELLEAEKDGRAIMIKTRAELDNTIKSLKDFNGSKEKEKIKVDELNRKYGESFGYYHTVAEWYNTLIQKSETYTQMLYLEAKAQAILRKAVEADEKIIEIDNTPDEKYDGFWKSTKRVFGNWFLGEKNDLNADWAGKNKYAAWNKARMERDEYLQEYENLYSQMTDIANKLGGAGKLASDLKIKNTDTLSELELKARKKIEDNAITLIQEGYERQRQEAALAFEREKERISDEERQRLDLYEKLRKVGEPVTTAQKDTILQQTKQQAGQARDIYEQTLAGINAAERMELEEQNKIITEALTKYQTYYQERLSAITKFQKDREALEKGGATEGQFAELNYQQEQVLSAIDEKFAMREESFQNWANSVVNLSLEKLGELLHEAQQELTRMELFAPYEPQLAVLRSKIAKYKQEIESKKPDTSPEKDSIKRWQDLQKVLSRCSREFNMLGKEIGGTVGEIISAAGEISTSALSMISSITELANWSLISTEMTAQGVSKTIQAVEKASVILTIISAAIQLMNKLQSLLSDSHEQYLNYAAKVNEINIMRDAVHEYELAVLKAKQAEESWFATNNLDSLRQAKEINEQVLGAYIDKATEAQAIYQNKSGGGWLTGAINWVMGNLSALSWWDEWRDIWGVGGYDEGQTAAINNLRIETRKKKSGFLGSGIGSKSQKTEDLSTWIKNQKEFDEYGNLFDEKGLINKELANVILDKYGNKLVGQTKETLEALVELREQYDEYLERLHEYVSSLYEPLVDNFVDSLWDWFDTGKDALDSFKDYASKTFRDIVSDMMRTVVLDKVFSTGENSFQEQLNNLYEEYASGGIQTEEELMAEISKLTASLIGRYENAIPDLQNIMETIAESLAEAGIDLKDSESYSQSGRSGAFTTMSQETGTKLEGLFTSVQMHISNVDTNVQSITDALGTALESIRKIEENTQYCKHLEAIKNDMERILRDGIITQ